MDMKMFVLVVLAGCGIEGGPKAVMLDEAQRTYAHPVKIDFMARAYFAASSPKSEGLGGNATSDNMPRPVATLDKTLRLVDDLQLLALDDQDTSFDKYDGFRVLAVNATNKPIEFNAQDSLLDIIHQAIDQSGKWADIEYMPRSWCGNSYHTLSLPAKSYWEFTAPRYDGSYQTKLRIRLTIQINNDEAARVVYSNEFTGRIDPRQFSDRQGHVPQSIMDPYNE